MSNRQSIVKAFTEATKTLLDGANDPFNIYQNVFAGNKLTKDIISFPCITYSPGPEGFQYLASGMRWNYLTVYARAYVKGVEDPQQDLEVLIQKIKNIVDTNTNMPYYVGNTLMYTTDVTLQEVSTDEGLLAPDGIAEVVFVVRYSEDNRLV